MLLSGAVSPESPCRYIFRVYLACRYIFRIYFRGSGLCGPVSIVFADSLVSRKPSVKSSHETNVAEKGKAKKKREDRGKRQKENTPFPTCFVSFPAVLFREASSRLLPVSLLPAQRFPAADTTGLLILIIDRGIIKVALVRGRFQLRISVSLGTIGLVDRRREGLEGGREGERDGRTEGQGEKSGTNGRGVPPSVCYCPSCSSFTCSLGRASRG